MKTLNKEIEIKGIGLHSGEMCGIRLLPSEIPGIRFRNAGGLSDISSAVVEEDSRLTGFVLSNGMKVRTGEHMLAAIAGMRLDAVIIESDAEEVPILDGSAHQWADAIKKCGTAEVSGTPKRYSVSAPIAVEENNGKRLLIALPSQELRVTYIIDYTGTPVGVQRTDYKISEESFYDIISRARTFGLTSELEYLRREGLAKGGSLENALIFDEKGLVGGSALRFPLECVTHKVADLLGDLTLCGSAPVAHYVAVCAGHSIHAKMVKKLKALFQ